MAHDVFISHLSKDKAIADGVCAALESKQIRCWFAPRDINPADTWAGAISSAIVASRVLVLIFSSEANGSQHIIREITKAASQEIPILPFRIENASPEGDLDFYLSSLHWLDALTEPLQEHIDRLVDNVSRLLPEKDNIEEILKLSSDFYTKPLTGRREAAKEIAWLAPAVSLKEIIKLCGSKERGERVAAFIALSSHLKKGVPASDLNKIVNILENGMKDMHSRVRYRVFEAIASNFNMAKRLKPLIEETLKEDKNKSVRDMAEKILHFIQNEG